EYRGREDRPERGRIHINDAQYFEGVEPEVWNFHIGGYQVCEKWLKDRRGRKFSYDDISHYQKVVVALRETARLMKEVDRVIESHGGWPGAFVHAGDSVRSRAHG
ncbi:MAG TPA: type ISP restriction/modification enzyme, partial [Sedimentisphaerales bacterium]|nr:type ISP restriction/modification enzyme [Sedimentisphaerales bacterium]